MNRYERIKITRFQRRVSLKSNTRKSIWSSLNNHQDRGQQKAWSRRTMLNQLYYHNRFLVFPKVTSDAERRL